MMKLMLCVLGVASALVALGLMRSNVERAQGLMCVALVCITGAAMAQGAP